MKNKFLKYLLILLIGAVSAASAYCAQLFLIIVTAAIGVIGAAWGIGYAAVAAGLSVAGIAAVTINDPILLACTAGMVAAGSLTLAIGLRKRYSYRGMLILLGLAAFIGIYLQTGLAYMLAGKPPYTGVVELMHEMEQYYASAGLEGLDLGSAISSIPTLFYGYTIVIAELTAFVTLIICKKLCTIFKCEVRPMDKFARWQLPRSFRIGVPIFAAGCFLLYVFGFRGADTILYAVLGLLAPMLFVEGLTFLIFIFTHGRRGATNVIVYVLLAFLCLISTLSVAVVGLVDLFFGIRRRIRRYDDKMREAFKRAEENGSSTVTVDFEDGRGPQIIAVRKHKHDEGVFFDDDRVDDSAADPFGDRSSDEKKQSETKGNAPDANAQSGQPSDSHDNAQSGQPGDSHDNAQSGQPSDSEKDKKD